MTVSTDTFAPKDFTTLTIVSGVVTATQTLHTIKAAAGTAPIDDLDTITIGHSELDAAGIDWRPLIILRAATGETIALKHGTGNLYIPGGNDAIMTENNWAFFSYDGTNLYLINQAITDTATGATIAVGAEVPDDITVTVQLTNLMGGDLASRASIPFYLADDATGDVPSTVAPDGGIVIGTDGAMIEWTANLSGLLISEADGDIDIVVTDSGTPTFYLILVMPDGTLSASAAITFA